MKLAQISFILLFCSLFAVNFDSAIAGSNNANFVCNPNGAFIEEDGLVIIEAETDFNETNGGWDLEAGNPTFLVAGSNHFGNTNGQTLTYTINISTTGVYRLHMKSVFSGNSPSDENDSWFRVANTSSVHFFCVQGGGLGSTSEFENILNGSPTSKTLYYPVGNGQGRNTYPGANPGVNGFFKIFRGGNEGNKWDAKTIDAQGYPVYAYFPNSGTYTIQMSERSAGHKVDRFALAHVDEVSSGVPVSTLNGSQSAQCGVVLPVRLLEFTGNYLPTNKHVKLEWTVAQELNLSSYEVERSYNAQDWTTIGSVEPQSQVGAKKTYYYEDANTFEAQQDIYYRLKINDIDGSYEFSSILNTQIQKSDGRDNLQVYPNPANAMVNLQMSEKAVDGKLVLLDIFGKIVIEKIVDSENLILDLINLPPGFYSIQVSNPLNQYLETSNLIKN